MDKVSTGTVGMGTKVVPVQLSIANINEVEGLALSQEDKPQTTSPTLSMTFRLAIFRCELCVCSVLMLAGLRALRGRPLPRCRSILPVMSVFLIEVFTS